VQVQYRSDQFLDKNKDYVVPEHQDLLGASKCPFVAGLFPPLPEETSKSSKFSSIGSRFKVSFFSLVFIAKCMDFVKKIKSMMHQHVPMTWPSKLNCSLTIRVLTNHVFISRMMQLQLQQLMEILSSTEPHYIRCVKPNNLLKPAIFENANIIQQLRCGVSIV